MRYIIAFLALIGGGISGAQAAPSTNTADWFIDPATGVVTWVTPSEATIPNDATGNMIRYGKLLLTETYKYLGAESSMAYSGNRISCSTAGPAKQQPTRLGAAANRGRLASQPVSAKHGR